MLQRPRYFYLIGPPVESASEVADVLYYVLSQMHDTCLEGFQVSQTAGPLPYIDRWMSESNTHQRLHRPGMHGAELWCLQASWSRPQLRKPAFTVVVLDTDFFSQSSEHSKTSTLTIRVWLGSDMGIYLKLLQIVQDQRKALRTAEKVSPLLCIRNMLEFIIKPDVFATRPWPQKGGYYVCLAMLF